MSSAAVTCNACGEDGSMSSQVFAASIARSGRRAEIRHLDGAARDARIARAFCKVQVSLRPRG